MSKKLIRFDWAMKKLLRNKANFDVLEGFLCALFDDENVKILNILESETNQENESDKFNRVDLLVEDGQKRKIYIEIQNTRESDYLESLLYATSKIIVENQALGDDFKNISKIISIGILYFNLGIGDDYLYYGNTELNGLNTGNKLIVKKRIQISETFKPKYEFIEKNVFPEYYLIIVERYKNVVKTCIDEWIYMIKNNEVSDKAKSKNIDKAKKKLDEINMSEQERKVYEKYLINLAKERDVINTAKEEGIIEGEIKGEIKGEIQGKIKGKEERSIEIAKSLKKRTIPIEIIMETTGLTKDKIDEL